MKDNNIQENKIQKFHIKYIGFLNDKFGISNINPKKQIEFKNLIEEKYNLTIIKSNKNLKSKKLPFLYNNIKNRKICHSPSELTFPNRYTKKGNSLNNNIERDIKNSHNNIDNFFHHNILIPSYKERLNSSLPRYMRYEENNINNNIVNECIKVVNLNDY